MRIDIVGIAFLFIVVSMIYFLMYVATTPNGIFTPVEVLLLYLGTSLILIFIAIIKKITGKGL